MEKKSKGKDRAEPAPPKEDKIWDVPKSKEVLRLEGVVAALRGVQGGGKAVVSDKPCFCQGTCYL
jgi:hypothetical protein